MLRRHYLEKVHFFLPSLLLRLFIVVAVQRIVDTNRYTWSYLAKTGIGRTHVHMALHLHCAVLLAYCCRPQRESMHLFVSTSSAGPEPKDLTAIKTRLAV